MKPQIYSVIYSIILCFIFIPICIAVELIILYTSFSIRGIFKHNNYFCLPNIVTIDYTPREINACLTTAIVKGQQGNQKSHANNFEILLSCGSNSSFPSCFCRPRNQQMLLAVENTICHVFIITMYSEIISKSTS